MLLSRFGILAEATNTKILTKNHPDSLRSRPNSLHSHLDSSRTHPNSRRSHHSPYYVPRFPIPVFTDSQNKKY